MLGILGALATRAVRPCGALSEWRLLRSGAGAWSR